MANHLILCPFCGQKEVGISELTNSKSSAKCQTCKTVFTFPTSHKDELVDAFNTRATIRNNVKEEVSNLKLTAITSTDDLRIGGKYLLIEDGVFTRAECVRLQRNLAHFLTRTDITVTPIQRAIIASTPHVFVYDEAVLTFSNQLTRAHDEERSSTMAMLKQTAKSCS